MLKFIIGICLFYLLLTLILYWKQERFIFYPTVLPQDYPFTQFRDFEEAFLEVDESTKLHALFFRVPNPKGSILYFHGNARALNDWGYAANDFIRLGYEVLMPDYRSYGKSTGPLSEAHLNADALKWLEYLQANKKSDKLIYYGRSLGSGLATELATQHQPDLLVLETPYLSLLEMAKTKLAIFPTSWLMSFHFRNDLKINTIDCPIHIFHGTKDALIPYRQAQKLASGKATLHTFEGATHNNLAQFPAFHETLHEILP